MKTEQGRPRLPLRKFLADFESGSRPKGGVGGILTGIPSLGGEHLNRDGGFKFEKIKFVPRAFAKAMTRGHLKPGDVLVVKDGATTGKVSLVRSDFPYQDAVINEHVFRLQLKEEYQPAYVFYFLYSQIGQQQILSDFRGAAQGGISQGFVDKVFVPVVTLDEQQKIVEEIEKQFTRLEAGVSALKRVQANLKRYRAAVLKAACEGKLVPANTNHWRTTTIGELSSIVTKGSSPNWQGFEYCENGIIFVRSQNVAWGKLDLSDVAHLPVAFNNKEKKSVLKSGDVLLNIVGASIGRAAVATAEIAGGNVNQAVAVIRPLKDRLLPQLLVCYLLSERAQAFIHAQKVDVARANFSLEQTRNLPIYLPDLAEQTRIVAEVERRLSAVEELEAVVNANLQRAARLRQSILHQAFTGEL